MELKLNEEIMIHFISKLGIYPTMENPVGKNDSVSQNLSEVLGI